MGNISYTAHVSNKKSAITSKSKLAAVAKHNLRKYKSSDYSKDNICIIYGTSNLIDDVKTVYHKEFDEALEEYNKKQIRPDRKIEDYFEHVAGKEQDMAVEIIIQIGDREWFILMRIVRICTLSEFLWQVDIRKVLTSRYQKERYSLKKFYLECYRMSFVMWLIKRSMTGLENR